MKIFKNKFFLSILGFIFALFCFQFYFISQSYKVDRNSYVTLTEGQGTLIAGGEKLVLKLSEKVKIGEGDTVSTVGAESIAVIEWGDKSITRMSGNSRIVIKKTEVSEDLQSISISFELLKGKTWSQVVSIFTNGSHFHQEVKSVTAAVRGTVFEASYDDDYFHVRDHEVQITKDGTGTYSIYPGETFSIKTFQLENIKKVFDKKWIELNEKMDTDHINQLKENFISSLKNTGIFQKIYEYFIKVTHKEYAVVDRLYGGENANSISEYIKTLSPKEKEKVMLELKKISQSLNFEKGEDEKLYNFKLQLRQVIMDNSNDEEYNKTLMRYSIYDLGNMFSYEYSNQIVLQKTLDFLNTHKSYIDLAENEWKSTGESFEIIKKFLTNKKEDFSIETLQETFKSLDKQGQEAVHGVLNKFLELHTK